MGQFKTPKRVGHGPADVGVALIIKRIGANVEVTVNPRVLAGPFDWGRILVGVADAVAREAAAQGIVSGLVAIVEKVVGTPLDPYETASVAIHFAMAERLEELYPKMIFVSDAVVRSVAKATWE